MPIDIATLRTEAQKFTNQTPDQIADALNAESVDIDRDVPVVEVRKVVLPTGELAKTKVFAETRPANSAAILAAITFVETLSDRDAVIPAAAKAQVDGMLAALVGATVLSPESKAAMLALFAGKTSRAKQLFGEPVVAGHVARARS